MKPETAEKMRKLMRDIQWCCIETCKGCPASVMDGDFIDCLFRCSGKTPRDWDMDFLPFGR